MKGFWESVKGVRRFWPACEYSATKKEFVEADGIRFWVETEGEGIPLVLVHGGPGGNHCYFHPKMSLLANKHFLVYYDLRGHYMSSGPVRGGEYGLLQDAKDLESLRIAMGLGKIDVLGHSYGGMVALMYGLMYPESLKHLILCSAPVDMMDEDVDRLLATDPISRELVLAQSEEVQKALYYRFYFHNPLDPKSLYYNEFSRKSFSSLKSRRVCSYYENDKTELDWKKSIPCIHQPMLLLCGKHDPLVIPERIKNIIDKLNNVQLIIFEKSRHDPFTDEPDQFAKVVNDFLS